MFSLELRDHIRAILAAMPADGVLRGTVATLAHVHAKTIDLIRSRIDLSDAQAAINTLNAARSEIASVLGVIREVQPRKLLSATGELQKAIEMFSSLAEPDTKLRALHTFLDSFIDVYETCLRVQTNENALDLVSAAQPLSAALNATQNALVAVSNALNYDSSGSESAEHLTLILFSSNTYRTFVEKLVAVGIIYDEIAQLFGVTGTEQEPSIVKVESGSLWLDIAGSATVITLVATLITRATQWIYRTYTDEGRIAAIPRNVEAVEAVLHLRATLLEQGIGSPELDEHIEKAAVKIATNLDRLLRGEPRVEVNRQLLSVAFSEEQRFVAESRQKQIEGQVGEQSEGGADVT